MLTPEEHYAEADRLLASVDESRIDLPFNKARIAKAQVHATLATATPRTVNNVNVTGERL